MFVVCVTFSIAPGSMDGFLPLMQEQARISLENESGCQRFDVCGGGSDNEVFLYEIYSDPNAFDRHLQSDHFLAFDRAVTSMVTQKVVKTYSWMKSGTDKAAIELTHGVFSRT